MRRALKLALVGVACLMLCGCAGWARTPVIPPVGFVYTGYKAPLDVDYDDTKISSKKGTASTINVLGLVGVGDCSARAAAEDGGITTVHNADYEMLSVLGVFSRFTTIVYGD